MAKSTPILATFLAVAVIGLGITTFKLTSPLSSAAAAAPASAAAAPTQQAAVAQVVTSTVTTTVTAAADTNQLNACQRLLVTLSADEVKWNQVLQLMDKAWFDLSVAIDPKASGEHASAVAQANTLTSDSHDLAFKADITECGLAFH